MKANKRLPDLKTPLSVTVRDYVKEIRIDLGPLVLPSLNEEIRVICEGPLVLPSEESCGDIDLGPIDLSALLNEEVAKIRRNLKTVRSRKP